MVKMFGDGQMDLHGTTVTGDPESQKIPIKIRIMYFLITMVVGMIKIRILKENLFANVMQFKKCTQTSLKGSRQKKTCIICNIALIRETTYPPSLIMT